MVVWAFLMGFCAATRGAKNGSLGSPPALAYAVTRASGLRPCARANASDVTTSALAPSFRLGAFPAVTVPFFSKDGTVTAGNAPSLNDGASALVVTSLAFARAHGLKPLARVTAYASAGGEPKEPFFAPLVAAQNPIKK